MLQRKLLAVAISATLTMLATPAWSATAIQNRTVEVTGAGATSDALIAVEANRTAIINRLVREHSATLFASAIPESSFRNALSSLRADQLLAASLVSSFSEVTAIVDQTSVDGASLQRYVAVAPTAMNAVQQLPAAEVFLVREGDSLSMLRANQLNATSSTQQLVGYFVPPASSSTVVSGSTGSTLKDGPGSGSGSWIGFTSGGNQATGTSSAVAAGANNLASGQNSFVGAGVANQANGISSLVIGGFDNRATGTDSLVGAGAGHRATGARAVIVGGGYNLASGNFSFIGGGGRDGVVNTAAGTDAKDHIASGKWTTIGGGVGNRATGLAATVAGGGNNVASGSGSFVGGGGTNGIAFPNVASGSGSSIVGGFDNTASGNQSFIGGGYLNSVTGLNASVVGGFTNLASGGQATVLGGRNNIASGVASIASGQYALTQTSDATPVVHNNTFVFSDGSSGNFRSTEANTFSVLATGGMRFLTQATDSSGEATSLGGVTLDTSGNFNFTEFGQNFTGTGANKGVGTQSNTVYVRVFNGAYWYSGGVHAANQGDPGAGGTVLASLTNGGATPAVTGTFRAQVITATSDRNAKTDFVPLNAKMVLAKVVQMPISTWSYKNEAGDGIRHIGPVAQDFKELFNVGYDDKSIATVDADGVAFAAIKGLHEELQVRDARIVSLEATADLQRIANRMQHDAIEAQRARLVLQQQRIAALEAQTGELAAGQLQLHELATVVKQLQQELASLRKEGPIARNMR